MSSAEVRVATHGARMWSKPARKCVGNGSSLRIDWAGEAAFSGETHNCSTSSDIMEVSAGTKHSLILSKSGLVYCAGDNSLGQCGLSNVSSSNVFSLITNLTNIISISSGEKHSLALNSSGFVYSFGDNSNGKLVNFLLLI